MVAIMPQTTMMPASHLPRAPALDDQRSWHFEQEVSNKEDAGAEADDGIVETQIALHLQLGHAQVGAVDIGEQIDENQERHQTSGHAAVSALGDLEVGGGMQEKMVSRGWLEFGVMEFRELSRAAAIRCESMQMA